MSGCLKTVKIYRRKKKELQKEIKNMLSNEFKKGDFSLSFLKKNIM
jgi:hypothetical protein